MAPHHLPGVDVVHLEAVAPPAGDGEQRAVGTQVTGGRHLVGPCGLVDGSGGSDGVVQGGDGGRVALQASVRFQRQQQGRLRVSFQRTGYGGQQGPPFGAHLLRRGCCGGCIGSRCVRFSSIAFGRCGGGFLLGAGLGELGLISLPAGFPAGVEGKGGEDQRHDRSRRKSSGHPAPHPSPPHPRLVCRVAAPLQQLLLVGGERKVGGGGPGLVLGQPPAPQQVILGSPGPLPVDHGSTQPAAQQELFAMGAEPIPHSPPLGEQGLVGDLDRRASGGAVPVEGEQSALAEPGEHDVQCGPLEAETPQLADRDSASGVTPALARRDQAQKHLSRHAALFFVELGEELLGTAAQCGGHAAGGVVGSLSDQVRVAGIEQRSERELEQRQRTRLAGDVADHAIYEARLEAHPQRSGRFGDDGAHLVPGRRRQRNRGGLQEPPEFGVRQRAVEEVGAERDDDPNGCRRLLDGRRQGVEEAGSLLLALRHGEQLFELVDDEQQRRPVREMPLGCLDQAPLVLPQQGLEVGRRRGSDPVQRRCQPLEWMRAG